MARTFDRWKHVGSEPLGRGGQSIVYRVVDRTGEFPGEYALKNVLNPNRHERFKAEIEAVKGLHHPNIIKLIDHSALADGDQVPEKQYLVTPIANGGSLSTPSRLSLYKGELGSVLQIAKQIGTALAAAHANKVIHRDIKPENILFTGHGHELWLSDFGICLIRDRERATETAEIVGPRSFMAPELEEGGKLDVTPAADIYSFGKVIYFALTGGTIVPRERVDAEPFAKGERHRMLELLVRRMICPLNQRLETVDKVLDMLIRIEEWEQQAHLHAIGPAGLSAVETLQRKAMEAQSAAADAHEQRERRAATVETIKYSFGAWLRDELEKTASLLSSGSILQCLVRALTGSPQENWLAVDGRKIIRPVSGFELMLTKVDGRDDLEHLLQVRLCIVGEVKVIAYTGSRPPPERETETEFAMIPFYRIINVSARQPPPQQTNWGFITRKDFIGHVRTEVPTRRRRPGPLTQVKLRAIDKFWADASHHGRFRASEWPGAADRLREELAAATDAFLVYLQSQ
jgi:serine/threonine protein kinase